MNPQEYAEKERAKRSKLKKRYCEICGSLIGTMSIDAYNAGHFHCDKDSCAATCRVCQGDVNDYDGWSFEPSNDYVNF